MAYATVQEFLGRISDGIAGDLSGSNDSAPPDEPRIQRALDDATAELDGWIPRLPAALRPEAPTLRVHTLKVATYLLTLDRPGKEYEQIRNAYTDTIDFYRTMVAANGGGGAPLLGAGDAPDPIFGAKDAMKGFAP